MEYVEGKDGGAPIDLERLIADRCLNSQRTRELMLQVVQAASVLHTAKGSFTAMSNRAISSSTGTASLRWPTSALPRCAPAVRSATSPWPISLWARQSILSPEQQRDAASVDHRSDIYAAGVMLYQMLTG